MQSRIPECMRSSYPHPCEEEEEDECKTGQRKNENEKKRTTTGTTAIAASTTITDDRPLKQQRIRTNALGDEICEGDGEREEGEREESPVHMAQRIMERELDFARPILLQRVSTGTVAARESVSYTAQAFVFAKLEATTSRLIIVRILSSFLAAVSMASPRDLVEVLYLLVNKVAPDYLSLELGIGDAILTKAIAVATGRDARRVTSDYQARGDLGEVAQESRSTVRTLNFGGRQTSTTKQGLIVREVLDSFREIARIEGSGSQDRKVQIVKRLLIACTDAVEAKFIIRALQGKLRIRVKETTVLVALSRAFADFPPPAARAVVQRLRTEHKQREVVQVDEQLPSGEPTELEDEYENEYDAAEAAASLAVAAAAELRLEAVTGRRLHLSRRHKLSEALVRQAYSECPNYEQLVGALLSAPIFELSSRCRLTTGVPVAPMLAKPSKSFMEVLKKLSGRFFTCEYKYDGERAQIHMLPDGTVKVFSRNSKDDTGKYSDLAATLRQAVIPSVTSFILDTEAVAVNRATGQILPFQVLSTRKRTTVFGRTPAATSHTDTSEASGVAVMIQAFDLILLNDRPLLSESLQRRRELLRLSFREVPCKFGFAISLDQHENGDTEPMERFLQESVRASCEGLMLKILDGDGSSYLPSVRSNSWLKLKKDYLSEYGVADSLDLVVIGAYMGRGKRTGVYGAYLLAAYDLNSERFQSTCKVGTGFSDEALEDLTARLQDSVVHNKPSEYLVADELHPDVWFRPALVVEVRAADLSLSPVHKCAIGIVDQQRGIALRFPRFVRLREDKRPCDCTNARQVAEMYRSQDVIIGGGGSANDSDFDFL